MSELNEKELKQYCDGLAKIYARHNERLAQQCKDAHDKMLAQLLLWRLLGHVRRSLPFYDSAGKGLLTPPDSLRAIAAALRAMADSTDAISLSVEIGHKEAALAFAKLEITRIHQTLTAAADDLAPLARACAHVKDVLRQTMVVGADWLDEVAGFSDKLAGA